MTREEIRRRASRVVLLLLVGGVAAAVFLVPESPAQSTVILAVLLGCTIALYLIEVWARTGGIR
jgi:hypothetical protein